MESNQFAKAKFTPNEYVSFYLMQLCQRIDGLFMAIKQQPQYINELYVCLTCMFSAVYPLLTRAERDIYKARFLSNKPVESGFFIAVDVKKKVEEQAAFNQLCAFEGQPIELPEDLFNDLWGLYLWLKEAQQTHGLYVYSETNFIDRDIATKHFLKERL